MSLRSHLRVVRRGASHMFDVHEPATFLNGVFLFMTFVMAFLGARSVDNGVSYALSAGIWILVVYLSGFELLGHAVDLEEKLAEPHESLQAMRELAAKFPIVGMLPFLFLSWVR